MRKLKKQAEYEVCTFNQARSRTHDTCVCQTMQINDIKSPAALSSKLFNDTGSLRDFVQNLLHHQNRKMMLCVDPTTNLRSILFS